MLAQALEGFSPTPEFPEIEEAQNLLAALAETEDVKNAAASRHRRLELQTSYGRALLWSKGFAAQETKAAFARAEELAADTGNVDERFATYYGLWLGSMGRGEMGSARETAQTFLREAEAVGRMTEVAAAHRYLGLTCLTQADLIEARAHCEEALRIYDPQRERDAKFRYGTDTAASATAYLANAKWLLGDFGQARELLEEAAVRAVQSSHVPTQVNVCCFNVVFEVFRDDAQAVLRAARSLLELSREHGIPIFSSLGAMFSSWARARLGEREAGVMELQQTLTAYTEQGSRVTAPLVTALLAELEAESAGDSEAMGRIDGALSLAAETGERWTDPMLHRIRGEILLKRDPTDTAPAEEAFLTAIAVAQQQKARSFGLRAALSLAKLYQSTGRAAGAHAVLAPALEGFSPTPELPEIAEAQALLAALPRAIRR